ncbi:MAG: C-terminal target protein [Flavipsychrobacter sp.]|nr:C-terminal target protein [Flavipsychrobacter sp.]
MKGNYFCVYGISNYIDEDATYPSHLQDYNCGTRTYDLSSGYNHAGTDIFLSPFDWNNMEDEHVEIIAAAPGTIIGKTDGNPDHNCAMGSGTWNSVYIQHSDGTVAWYGHMKTGTPTTKAVGATVVLGEHLGYVGSSGSSTGPHLHFEVHDASGNVRDPWMGSCNALPSLWNTQKPYYESQVNALMTHTAPPGFASCPLRDTVNAADTFLQGSKIYFAVYFHDEQPANKSFFKITRPDGTVYKNWSHTSTTSYAASYWYWSYIIPSSEPEGKWQFSDSFMTVVNKHDFYIGDASLQANHISGIVSAVTVYPNPMTDNITIEHGAASTVNIFDMPGRLQYAGDIISDKETINIAHLPPGMYIVQLTATDGSRQNIRVVKQ